MEELVKCKSGSGHCVSCDTRTNLAVLLPDEQCLHICSKKCLEDVYDLVQAARRIFHEFELRKLSNYHHPA